MQHRQEIARSVGNDASPRAKNTGDSAKNEVIFEQSGGLLRESALYFRLRCDFVALPLPAHPAHRSKKARPSMNFTKGARPTADFGRFGRKNTDSTAESLLFLTVSSNITANNRYFCNIFYPLMAQVHIAFCPCMGSTRCGAPSIQPYE